VFLHLQLELDSQFTIGCAELLPRRTLTSVRA
jgi:hypothetical protein